MEYLKKALSFCCQDCCKKRRDSEGSTQIIFPTSKKMSTKSGTLISRGTFAYLPQPDFYIPLGDDKMITTTMSPITKRKQSAPPVMTRTFAIQPISDYTASSMHKSWGEPQIRIEEDSDCNNVNNNSFTLDGSSWKSTESVNTQSSLSPTHRSVLNTKRLSVAQIAANHSRRSSMCSFDISKNDLDSEMYESSDITQDGSSNGSLCFNISYNKLLELLTVRVISAKNLWNTEHGCSVIDSFVKVRVLSNLKKKLPHTNTAVKKGTSDPAYEENFLFHGMSSECLNNASVKFSVYSVDRPSKRKKLGVVIHQLANLCVESENEMGEKNIWRRLYVDGKAPVHGERGSIMLSMCYQPTDSQLKIYVAKGSELTIRDPDNKAYEGVYVKIALIGHGKVISKGKTKLIHPAAANPVFDEMITFTLPTNMIDQSCVIVSVNGKTSHGKRSHIGYVSLGPPFFSAGSGLEQWTKMLSVPFTMVSKWHSLDVWSKKNSSHNINECNMF